MELNGINWSDAKIFIDGEEVGSVKSLTYIEVKRKTTFMVARIKRRKGYSAYKGKH